ncbi:RES family NAD+ phosphorylase [Rhodanobacter sp. FDAARGOS 1247]|uniref:RES family NAD+ phosphorylase n=1 Tax=Rhodanobacter sp. FDAARGOS 1247 TaxID=2778082 RepID=UPI00194E4728|nr:RES family NAD+ phosphorylase [Rhodanobacter sp. FDAARGOS 1247]QRP63952.1 RES family NAD+ phosphorylase [Rhodanobacter sp. FDAARGOS 1247]
MPNELPPLKRVRWSQAYRIVPSRFPPVGVYDRIADPADMDAVFAIEALTNPRLREEIDALKLVPKAHRVSGPGSTPVMAAFTHLNPEGSRFSDGTWGVFYAAHSVATAVEETVYHREQFMAATSEPPCEVQMRCYRTSVDSKLHDLRGGWSAEQAADSYVASVALARRLRGAGSPGIVFDSARHAGGECIAAFFPDVVAPCVQARHLVYRWDGTRIAQVLEVSELKRSGPNKS